MIDFEKLKEKQIKLAKKVIVKDSFEKLEIIGGVDCAFSSDNVVVAIVVYDCRTMEVKEKAFAVARANMPYIAGFLAYREAFAAALHRLQRLQAPDVMILDGNGILHPRRFGLASHMGVAFDIASIGIAKQLLVGEVKGNVVYIDKEARGAVVVTREKSKPVYISPGHKISLKTSVEIVKSCMRFPHKLPEPLHLAHKYANEARDKIEKGESQ